MIFGVDNSLSSHPQNFRNNFLVLGERDNFAINGSLDPPEKEFSIGLKKRFLKFTS